jgi:peroxiredoxin
VVLTLVQRRINQKLPSTAASAVPTIPAVPALRGKPSPAFELTDLGGAKVHPSDFKDKVLLINFWATWCGSCVAEFPDLQTTFRMYGTREFAMVTVSANGPDEQAGVLKFLQKQHATTRNLLFASTDTYALQAAFDAKWESAVPYTILIDKDGKVLYRREGEVDLLALRRTILANLRTDYAGFREYWVTH